MTGRADPRLRRPVWGLLLPGVAALAGCTGLTPPRPNHPAPPVRQAYAPAPPAAAAGLVTVAHVQPAPERAPFEGVKELSAEVVITQVLARNPTLAQMAAAAEAAAARYPQVTALDDPMLGVSVAPGAWGPNDVNGGYRIEASQKLVANQVQLGHPEATIALLNPKSEINAHFSMPPYQETALKDPAVRSLLSSTDVLGGPAHITNSFTTQKFHDANPKLVKAFIAAVDEASELIAKSPKEAAEIYIKITKEKTSVDDMVALFQTPGAIFTATPVNSKVYADYMQRAGIIKRKADSWKDYFFSDIHDRKGS